MAPHASKLSFILGFQSVSLSLLKRPCIPQFLLLHEALTTVPSLQLWVFFSDRDASQGASSHQFQQSQPPLQSRRGGYQPSSQSYTQPQHGGYLSSQQSRLLSQPRCTMYLIVYKDAVNPAHWSIFVTQPGSERVGTLIHVKSQSLWRVRT